ncbi:MAG: ATP synthase subunit I [Betaproteobacteria bacterium]|nr:ATP synthase subunit I [Betaproteobacteria bacterium]
MRAEYRRLIGLQGVVTVVGAAIAFFAVSGLAAGSFVFGGGIVLASAAYLAWRFEQGRRLKKASPQWHVSQAYVTAFQRFLWAAGMLVVGFKLLELAPLWMLAGFFGGQAVWLAAPIWVKVENVK